MLFDLPRVSVSNKVYRNGKVSSKTEDTGCALVTASVPTGDLKMQVSAVFHLDKIHRWYPVGYGDQPLYELRLKLGDGHSSFIYGIDILG